VRVLLGAGDYVGAMSSICTGSPGGKIPDGGYYGMVWGIRAEGGRGWDNVGLKNRDVAKR